MVGHYMFTGVYELTWVDYDNFVDMCLIKKYSIKRITLKSSYIKCLFEFILFIIFFLYS